MAWAWVMIVSGIVTMALSNNPVRRRAGLDPKSVPQNVGLLLIGAGLAVDGLPTVVGWSSSVNVVVASVGIALCLTGAVVGACGEYFARSGRSRDAG